MNPETTVQAFQWIISILSRKRVPYQISGGLAAIAYGSRRPLYDIDIEIPESKFPEIFAEVSQYWRSGPTRVKDEHWDVLMMSLDYHGQRIDVTGCQMARIYDPTEERWLPLVADFKKAEMRNLFGLDVPVIGQAHLIAYKSILGREVDRSDIQELLGEA